MESEKHQEPETQRSPSSHPVSESDPLNLLAVFDRLEVGPVRLEAKRLIAPYRIVGRDGQSEQTDLIYSFGEKVFVPDETESKNLAAVMAAQVALNYGLFCDRIIFHGPFDETDRRFLRDMAENTAREIIVKKFLEPNPFLVGEAANLRTARRRKYLRARLEFRGERIESRFKPWEVSGERHCILSSGGKDSLLSYGVINELGKEVHPIFANESGRHWFTALNAFRHFEANVPHTARVWVNSDRVFAWMLRRMPFIRKDFAEIRSDEYPVRLWTVAVFLFGVLPLMRKRGIGRLVIGDEFDTSRRLRSEGIFHYDGLFDQSIWFDAALTRYFGRKGWGVSQFSVLRPLSELLIQTILAKRYPELQAHQISCHAAHKEDDRVYPCGRCEKCRRIVGVLSAVDGDPKHCGYKETQIAGCLKNLVEKGTYAQTEAESSQLFLMLAEKGKITLTEEMKARLKPYPQAQMLRFDPEVSPVTAIPSDLREPLYRIYQEYALGAVKRSGKKWVPFDLSDDPALHAPSSDPENGDTVREMLNGETIHWGELTWPDAEELFETVDTVLLPVGAMEQHGPHLPLDTDAFDADYLARQVASACTPPRPLVLPPVPYGVSYHHDDFKGTVSISNNTLSRLVYDIGMSVARNGFKKLVIINGHGGNAPALNYAAQMINRDARIFVCVDTGETSDVDIDRLIETPNDVHAGEIETSTSLAVRPHLVKTDRMFREIPEFSSRYLNFTSKRGVSWYAHTQKISASGVMGDPARASVQKGEQIWEVMISRLTDFVETLKGMTLEEIYQRKY